MLKLRFIERLGELVGFKFDITNRTAIYQFITLVDDAANIVDIDEFGKILTRYIVDESGLYDNSTPYKVKLNIFAEVSFMLDHFIRGKLNGEFKITKRESDIITRWNMTAP